ncbi:hypothetical protein L365_02428 [Klebsiella pneumoniae MGH 19]|uniref:hypothetical protein n=1 Tax=Klebsiella pneumoniae TaxID=573 RepID=UPI0003BE3FF7|nr:hypothetical protein [Klebsiella pneumoniae]ESN37029.1 hypothetical protein L365_02428 [Klebsiella pneumoniae MGH 19]
MAIIQSQIPTTGNRVLLPYTRLDPAELFAAHKARVLADGGEILNESSLMQEITDIVAAGLWQYAVSLASPEWGIKRDAEGYVTKMYGLVGPDYLEFIVAGQYARRCMLDTTTTPPSIRVQVNLGAAYLRTETPVRQQKIAGRPYIISAILADKESADNRGVVMAFNPVSGNTNPIVYEWCIRNAAGRAESSSYYLSGKYPDTGEDNVKALSDGYVSMRPSACLVEPAAGRGKNFSNGLLVSTSDVTKSGEIPDMTGVDVHIYIGSRYTANYSATGADTDGMVGRIRCFGYATEEQAKLISQRS